jgi:hypothetical protein
VVKDPWENLKQTGLRQYRRIPRRCMAQKREGMVRKVLRGCAEEGKARYRAVVS